MAESLCFGVARHYFRLAFLLDQLLNKPLKTRDTDLRCLGLIGLHQLIHLRIPDHAAIAETVGVTAALGKPWARGLINAVFAKSFDDISIVPTFVLTPLTYLGGVFYTISMLPDFWQNVSRFNPILYMVNTFRYGFHAGSPRPAGSRRPRRP